MAFGPHLPLIHNECWMDIVATWRKYPEAFTKGCGQETMAFWVRQATGEYWPRRTIRRVLLAASNQGHTECAVRGSEYKSIRIVDTTLLSERRVTLWEYRLLIRAASPRRNKPGGYKLLTRVVRSTGGEAEVIAKMVRFNEHLVQINRYGIE